jgi:hypothetical protein
MKKSTLLAAPLIAAALAGTIAARPAQAQFKFTYTAGVQVQNLEASDAQIQIVFYGASGAAESNPTADTIPASGSKTYFPLSVAAGFNGSAVVSSDKRVAAVVNVLGNGGAAGASYVGFSEGATSINIPLLMKNNFGYDTFFRVQNAGANPANITVNYSDGTTASASNIAPGASATFNQASEASHPTVFAAKVTSNEPIVATVIEEDAKTMFAYNAFTAGAKNLVLPLVNANNSGILTGIQIQNAGTAATNVTLSYSPAGAGAACSETQSIAPGASATFALDAFAKSVAGEDCANGATFVGGARVSANTGDQPLVAIVNQVLPGTFGEAYGGFDGDKATDTVVFPLVMDRNFGYYTGFNVQNVGTAAATVNCTFTGTSYSVSKTLQPGEAMNDLQNNKIANAYVGSGTCTGGAGSKIVGVMNEVSSAAGVDSLLVYEGINK